MFTYLIYAVVLAASFGFGFLVGNRSAKGEGAAALAAAKADYAKLAAAAKADYAKFAAAAKTDAAVVVADAKKI